MLENLQQLPVECVVGIAVLLGLVIGSFLNVVIYRLPKMMQRQWDADVAEYAGREAPEVQSEPFNLMHPASTCPHCGHAIRWYENIPILSWVFLRGRCSSCHAPISWRYPAVEAATGLLFGAVAWHFGASVQTLLWCAVVAALVALAWIDWDTTLLPDSITLPLLWAGLVAAQIGWTIPVGDALWGAVAGYLVLWAVTALFKLVTGRVGMGNGDFKLLAALGAWLGWQMLIPVVLVSSLVGAVVGIGLKLGNGLREGGYMPYGPFLAGAGLAVVVMGPAWVLAWFGGLF